MRRLWRLLALAAVLCVLPCGLASSATNITVRLSETNRFTLLVTVSNLTAVPARVFPESLPWEKNAMVLIAVSTKALPGKLLEESGTIAGTRPVGKRVTIEPGHGLGGEINLKERFLSIEAESRESDIVVFWSYQTRGANQLAIDRVGGMVVISAQK